MRRSDTADKTAQTKMPQRRWLSVIVAVTANGVLFYVLALAWTSPPSRADAEYDIMQIALLDLPVIRETETDIADRSEDLILAAPEEMPVACWCFQKISFKLVD